MNPFIGANILYVLPSGPQAGEARMGLITRVMDNGNASITCLPDPAFDGVGYIFAAYNVPEDPTKQPGTWHWPTAAQS